MQAINGYCEIDANWIYLQTAVLFYLFQEFSPHKLFSGMSAITMKKWIEITEHNIFCCITFHLTGSTIAFGIIVTLMLTYYS